MKVIYIAGKYQADTEWGLIQNIRHAEDAALKLWKAGWAVICPHKNTAHFGGLLDDPKADHKLWLDGDLEIVRRCDAIYILDGFKESGGAMAELREALRLGLEIYYETMGVPVPKKEKTLIKKNCADCTFRNVALAQLDS